MASEAMPEGARAAGRSAAGRFALTRSFAAACALAVGLFSLGMGWLLSSFLATRMLARDAALSRDFVQGVAQIQQVAGFLRAPSADPPPSVAEFFAHVAAMPDVLRANVYGRERQVLWSSQPALIGRVFPGNDELERALAGEVVVHLDEHGAEAPKREHAGLAAQRAGGYVEDYLPVYDDGGGAPLAVIEVYRHPVALFEAIASGQRRVWLGALGGGLGLFLALVWFVRRTEHTLQRQHQRLLEAETLAQVGELSAAVAHSIRNPLGSIRSSAELARELDGDPRGVHTEIMRNVDRVEHLVRTLLTYVAEPAERPAAADLGSVLREATERYRAVLQAEGKPFEVAIAADLGTVAADPRMLAQVFDSVLANAAEATRAGERVGIATRRQGARAVVEVEDGGGGIPPERLDEVFKPFFTTKPRGLGLGLPLVRRIVQRLGGEIDIHSRPGAPTRVRIVLPLQSAR